jgi:hypothetical protein
MIHPILVIAAGLGLIALGSTMKFEDDNPKPKTKPKSKKVDAPPKQDDNDTNDKETDDGNEQGDD